MERRQRGLIGTAIVAGAGVAVIQALVPGLAKRWFVDRLPLAMGLYSAALVGGGAFGAVAASWLAAQGGWHLALAVWAVPALVTLALWRAKAPRDAVHATAVAAPLTAFIRVPRAWQLALFFETATAATPASSRGCPRSTGASA